MYILALYLNRIFVDIFVDFKLTTSNFLYNIARM